MNPFETRKLLGIVQEKNFSCHTFFRDKFFGNKVTFDSEKIDFDIVGANGRRLAPFVHPKIGGKVVSREGFSTKSYTAPLVSPETMTVAEEFLKRSAGETIYGTKTPATRAAEAATRDLQMLDEMISRREEEMCAQALFNGKITVKGDGYDEELDFWNDISSADKPVTTLTTKWDSSGITADNVFADIRNIRTSMIKKGGFTPREMFCGNKVIETILPILTNAKALDARRVEMGQIDPSRLPNGVTYWGYLKDSAIDIYSYDEWYKDEDGNDQPMVPDSKVLFAASGVKTTMAYGAVCVAENEKLAWYAESRVPTSYIQKRPAGRVIKLESRPLPIINQVYGFHVLNPLA